MTFTIKPISTINPSSIPTFNKCSLQGVLIANHTPSLLPKSPSAVIGTINHKIMSKAVKGDISDFNDFKEIWNMYLNEAEEKLLAIPFSKHLVPLSKSIWDFSTRKKKCWDSVRPLLAEKTMNQITCSGKVGFNLFELRVSTPEKDIVGFIDAVIRTPDGPLIIDYKSGNALERDENGVAKIRIDYVIQLKLYAALYFLSFNKWPISPLKIIEIGGKEYSIYYDREEVLFLVSNARNLIFKINKLIQKNYRDQRRLEQLLSKPSPDSCKYCSYRPGCHAYWIKRTNTLPDTWPHDIRGKIVSIEKTGNGLLLIKLYQNKEDLNSIQIRGINPMRHLDFEIGNIYSFYNLRKENAPNNYMEGILTTIYPGD